MKKLILFLLIIAGLVYFYFWYVQGINLLLQEEDSLQLQSYTSFATRLPPKDAPEEPLKIPSWQSAAPMPTARTGAVATAVNGTIYVIGGIDAFARTVSTVEAFNVEKNIWSIVAPIPKPLHHAAAIAIDDDIYVLGGATGLATTPVDTFYVFHTTDNRWESMKRLPDALALATVVYDGENLHLLGGALPGGTGDTHYIYSFEKDEWSHGDSMLSSREGHAAALIDGNIYVAGGRQGSLAYNHKTLDVFRMDERLWERWESMPTRRSGVGYVTYDGKLYVFGGEAPTATFGAVEVFDPATRKWETLDPMPTARHSMAVAEVEGKIFVIGGGQRPGLSVSDINEVLVP